MRYRARFTDPDGRERSRSFPDGRKREADAFARSTETDISRGTWTDPQAGRITLRKFAEQTFLPSLTTNPSTQERIADQLRLHIFPALGSKPIGQLAAHPSVVQAWVRGLPLSPGSAKVVLSVLSGVLGVALEDGLISRNPCRSASVRAPKGDKRRVVPWAASRVAAMRAALPERYRAMADCGAGLGLRQGEAFAFAPEDVDWLRQVVHVRHQLKLVRRRLVLAPPKGGRDRDIPLPETVKLSLAAHISAFPPVTVTLPWEVPDGKPVTVTLIFTSATGRAIRRGDFDSFAWKKAREAAGVEPVRVNGFHALRHHFASVLLEGGVDIRTLAEYLGHHDASFTLKTYCHLMPGSGSRMRRVIDEAARKDGLDTARESGT